MTKKVKFLKRRLACSLRIENISYRLMFDCGPIGRPYSAIVYQLMFDCGPIGRPYSIIVSLVNKLLRKERLYPNDYDSPDFPACCRKTIVGLENTSSIKGSAFPHRCKTCNREWQYYFGYVLHSSLFGEQPIWD